MSCGFNSVHYGYVSLYPLPCCCEKDNELFYSLKGRESCDHLVDFLLSRRYMSHGVGPCLLPTEA
jgi:hypothetical protein